MRSTVRAMLSITFGDTEQMIAAAAGINAIHDRVHGHGYCAHDPDLQCWVHATLLDSSLESYERLVGPLTAHERDRYCAEAAIMEPLMGMPRGLLPRSWADLTMYMSDMMAGDTITVTDTSRALAKAVCRVAGVPAVAADHDWIAASRDSRGIWIRMARA